MCRAPTSPLPPGRRLPPPLGPSLNLADPRAGLVRSADRSWEAASIGDLIGPLLADSEEIGDVNEADGDTVDVRAHFGSGLMPTPTFTCGSSCWQGSYFHVRKPLPSAVAYPRRPAPIALLRRHG
jgi:hypothetical protein